MRGGAKRAVFWLIVGCLLACSERDGTREDRPGPDAGTDAGEASEAGMDAGHPADAAGPRDGGASLDARPADAAPTDALAPDAAGTPPCNPPLFEEPSDGLSINRAGTDGHAADLEPSTIACDLLARVRCDCVGVPVFVQDAAGSTLGAATCIAAGDATGSHAGVANPVSVALTPDPVRSFDLRAVQTVGSHELMSDPVHVDADCRRPELDLTPGCPSGHVRAPAGTTLEFTWTSHEHGEYTLEFREGDGTLVFAGSASGSGGVFHVPFIEGTFHVDLYGKDRFGNDGWAGPCLLSISEL